jgi:hypothetical protein
MTNVVIFTRRNTTNRWRYIAERLNFAEKVTIVGLLDDGCDINVMPSFYQYYHSQDTAKFALTEIGTEACQEIIQRCRLLRNLDRQKSLKMIGAMWQALAETIERLQPDLGLTFIIDCYPLDLLKRLLDRRNVEYVGLGGGILKDRIIITAQGEHHFISELSTPEIEAALTEITTPTFAPSVVASKKYNFARFLKTKLIWNSRTVLLALTRLWYRDPLNQEYLNTPQPGDDYYVRWQDWQVTKYMDARWEEKLNAVPFDKRVFVGLQYYPEATTDYWVRDLRLANCIESLTEIAKVLTGSDFTVFVKDHPVMFGLRRTDIFKSLSQIKNVVFVPYEVKSQDMITECKTSFTWTGTIGIQAALAGRCPVVTSTYYRTNEDFIYLSSWEDIASLPERIDRFQLPENLDEVRTRVLERACSTCIEGSINWLNFDPSTSDLTGTNLLINSLNRCLPRFVRSAQVDSAATT